MTADYLLLPVLALSCGLSAGILPKPELTPKPTTAGHRELIKEGIALHDASEFDRAIEKYDHVLAENPDDVAALYEKAFTLHQKKQYELCIGTALTGARYNSPTLVQFYTTIGSCYDDMGQAEKAIDVYREAVRRFPADYLLAYNLGLTYFRANRLADAKKTLQQGLLLKPDHPSSHWALAQIYLKTGYRIPALLALSRFLILEPSTKRSVQAAALLQSISAGNVQKKGSGEIVITFQDASLGNGDEGDFSTAELALGISAAAAGTDSAKEEASPFRLMTDGLATAFSLSVEGKKRSGFARTYYAPYFAELDKREFVETFLHFATQAAASPDNNEWLNGNRQKVSDFLAWSRRYEWPAKAK